jgi:hypothetical protein
MLQLTISFSWGLGQDHRMSGVCETWSLDELVQMTEEDMDSVLSFYESGKRFVFLFIPYFL